MFFSLGQQPKNNFFYQYRLGNVYLGTDAGWNMCELSGYTLVYKGYADDFDLSGNLQLIIDQTVPLYSGNFCVICYEHATHIITIKNDVWRSFPIFLHDDEVTNLRKSQHVAWTDSIVTIAADFTVTEDKFDAIGEIHPSSLSLQQAMDSINEILQDKTKKFLSHNQKPIRAHLSGGVDSLLVFSLLDNLTDHYELVKCQHFDYDKFWLCNQTDIQKNFWAYKQIHHWNDDCILTSGAPGDEFMLRSPVTIDLLLKYHGLSILELLKENPNCLHNDYFFLKKHLDIFNTQQVDQSLPVKEFHRCLCDIVINDWQHWHIGRTLTWTPLRDLRIFKILLNLPIEELIGQILDSTISKDLIEMNGRTLSKLISDQKNSYLPMKNLCDFLFD